MAAWGPPDSLFERPEEVRFQGQCGGKARAGGIGLDSWRVAVVLSGGSGGTPILKAKNSANNNFVDWTL